MERQGLWMRSVCLLPFAVGGAKLGNEQRLRKDQQDMTMNDCVCGLARHSRGSDEMRYYGAWHNPFAWFLRRRNCADR